MPIRAWGLYKLTTTKLFRLFGDFGYQELHKQFLIKLFAIGALFAATGCSVTGNTLAEITSGEQLVTNSVAETAQVSGIAETDAEIIKGVVTEGKTASRQKPLAWTNPQTGSSGAVIMIEEFQGRHGQSCKEFKTSVSNFAGISFFNGETCRTEPGEWVLSWFKSTG